MSQEIKVQKGIYEHYKGNRYEVIGTGYHSETEEEMVIYRALYKSEFGENAIWVRPLTMFKETVKLDDIEVPRFLYIGSK